MRAIQNARSKPKLLATRPAVRLITAKDVYLEFSNYYGEICHLHNLTFIKANFVLQILLSRCG